MSYDVNGRTAFITGAARGIGAAVARGMAARGARVALVGREPELSRVSKLGDLTIDKAAQKRLKEMESEVQSLGRVFGKHSAESRD